MRPRKHTAQGRGARGPFVPLPWWERTPRGMAGKADDDEATPAGVITIRLAPRRGRTARPRAAGKRSRQ